MSDFRPSVVTVLYNLSFQIECLDESHANCAFKEV